jgi:hypothetical protein
MHTTVNQVVWQRPLLPELTVTQLVITLILTSMIYLGILIFIRNQKQKRQENTNKVIQ